METTFGLSLNGDGTVNLLRGDGTVLERLDRRDIADLASILQGAKSQLDEGKVTNIKSAKSGRVLVGVSEEGVYLEFNDGRGHSLPFSGAISVMNGIAKGVSTFLANNNVPEEMIEHYLATGEVLEKE